MMVGEVRSFAKTVLQPLLRATEAARGVPEDARKTAHAMGLGALLIPESAGGAALGMTTAVLIEEALATGDPGAPFGLAGPGPFALALLEFADANQQKRLLAPFTADDGHERFGAVAWGEKKAKRDRPGLSTHARRDGSAWVLDGEKDYVINADRAEAFVVFACVDDAKGWAGTHAFVVPRRASGLHVGPRRTSVGLDAASFGSLRLEGVRVEESEHLVAATDTSAALVRFFAKYSLLVAARSVGLMQSAFDITRDFCETRKAFGKPIAHFQAVAFLIADRATDVEATRCLVHRAASYWDADDAKAPASLRLAWSAKAIASAQAHVMRAGDDAVQLHGGAGFIRDYPVEKFMRDAKQLQLTGLSRGHAEQLLAAIELDLPVDLGLVLPSAENQNAFV